MYELQTVYSGNWEPFDSESTFGSLEETLQAVRDLVYHFREDARFLGGDHRLRGPWRIVGPDGQVVESGR